MNRLTSGGLIATLAVSMFAIPAVATAQTQGPSYCNLITPTVRDVVQEAPAIAAVLNLDPALSDADIQAQRDAIGCGEAPVQSQDQARGELCAVLTEARVEELVREINDPNATRGLETVRPALGLILDQSREQLNCAAAETPVAETPASEAPVATPVTDDPDSAVDTEDVVLDKDGNAVTVPAPNPDRDCDDYATQAAAQARLDSNSTDPYNLDVDGDGVACEGLSNEAAEPVVVTPEGSANTGDGSTL